VSENEHIQNVDDYNISATVLHAQQLIA